MVQMTSDLEFFSLKHACVLSGEGQWLRVAPEEGLSPKGGL